MTDPWTASKCCCLSLPLLALAMSAAAVAAAAASAAASDAAQIPLTCQWSDWSAVSGRQCHWRNRTVGLTIQNRDVNKFVTFCSQLLRTRRKRCESPAAPVEQQRLQELDFLEPSAFMPSSEHQNDDPVVIRQPADACTDDRCGPLDGQWCYWIVYGGCDLHCRHAAKNETEVYIQKQRLCNCPGPRNNGRQCEGPKTVRELCQCVSLAASFTSFLRTTEGILIAVGVAVIVAILIACCISRVCCDNDDGTEDFKISELPHQQQQQQQQPVEPLLLNLDDPDIVGGVAGRGARGSSLAAMSAEAVDLCSLRSAPGNATDSTATSDEATSCVVRLPDCLLATQKHQQQHQQQHQLAQVSILAPPPLPPKRYKQRQQQQNRKQHQREAELPLKYTPPFPNET